jgi:adenylyltransferase/sulfurtransferase
LPSLKQRLEARTNDDWKHTQLALVGSEGDMKITIFKDGRALIHGKITPERARGWYSEAVGC